MTSRRDIEFPAEDGTVLRGWLYEPEGGGPSPTVVMAHGFSAVKEMYLDDFAALPPWTPSTAIASGYGAPATPARTCSWSPRWTGA